MAELRHRDALTATARATTSIRTMRCAVVEGDARTRAIAEGAGVADARMVAPARQAGVDVVAARGSRSWAAFATRWRNSRARATAKPISRTRCTTRWPGASRASRARAVPGEGERAGVSLAFPRAVSPALPAALRDYRSARSNSRCRGWRGARAVQRADALGMGARVLERHVGMVDSPLLSRFDLAAVIRQWQVKPADPQALAALSDAQRARSVVIVQDTFTRYFDTEQLATLIELAARMGFQVCARSRRTARRCMCRASCARSSRRRSARRSWSRWRARVSRWSARSGDDAHVSAGVPEGDAHRCAESCATAGVVAAGVAGGWYWRRCRRRAHVVPVTAALHREDQCARQRQAMYPDSSGAGCG